MKRNQNYIFSVIVLLSLFIASCSNTQQSTKNQTGNQTNAKDSLYVFDKVPVDTTKSETQSAEPNPSTTTTENISTPYYLVQIGAFSAQDRASNFVDKTQSLLTQKVKITFDQSVNLYVVRLSKIYKTHEEAERAKNDINREPAFKDAWVVTIEK